MSDISDPERRRIRDRKARALRARLEEGTDANRTGTDPPNTPIEIEGSDHLDEIVEHHRIVLVDCFADWCGPCRMMEPTIEALAADSAAAVVKVDVDRHPAVAEQLGARGVPTLVLFVGGEPVAREVGAQPRDTLEDLIEEHTR